MKVLVTLLLIIAIILGGGYLFLKYYLLDIAIQPGSGYDPKEIFEATLQKPMPTSIQNLQGDALTWQGYSAYLRFNASNEDIKLLIQQGYKSVSCDLIIGLHLPDRLEDSFSPPWNPDAIEIKECYRMSDIKNDWTHSGTNQFIIDRSKNEIYVFGIGD